MYSKTIHHIGGLLIVGMTIATASAGAQTVDDGSEVRVNPVAAGGGTTLLYPGGQYARVVPQLLQPGQQLRPDPFAPAWKACGARPR